MATKPLKYDPLAAYLRASTDPAVCLSFADIERIIGAPLPRSAREHPAWWANEAEGGSHIHARAWLAARYSTRHLNLNAQTVEFVRELAS